MDDKSRFCVSLNSTLFDVMERLERIRERGVVVMDADKVCGVLTMSDIVKALVEGKTMYAKTSNLFNPDFIYLSDTDHKKAFEIFQTRNLSILPVVDRDLHLLDVITSKDMMSRMRFSDQDPFGDMKAVTNGASSSDAAGQGDDRGIGIGPMPGTSDLMPEERS